jgi:hypothetical protein
MKGRAGQARSLAHGFGRGQVAPIYAAGVSNGDAVCWPAGPGAPDRIPPRPDGAPTRQKAGAPLTPSLAVFGGAPVLSAFHVPEQVTTTMRELS